MGKSKGKKGRQHDDLSDDGGDVDILAQSKTTDAGLESGKALGGKKAGKKGKKGKKDDDWDDDVEDKLKALSLEHSKQGDSEEEEAPTQQKTKKKENKKKKKKDDSDDEEEEEIVQKGKGKAVKPSFALLMGDSEEDRGSSDQSEDEVKPAPKANKQNKQNKAPTKAPFAMLEMDDSEGDAQSSGYEQAEEDMKTAPKANQKGKQKQGATKGESMEQDENQEHQSEQKDDKKLQKKKGKKDKKKKNKADDDEDIDAILAELEGKTALDKGIDFKDVSAMTPEQIAAAMEAEYSDEDDKKKKKKKDKKGAAKKATDAVSQEGQASEAKPGEGEEQAEDDDDKGDGEESTVKSTAQKKKEKKERQRLQKMEEKAKATKKGAKAKDEEEVKKTEETQEEVKADSAPSKEASPAPDDLIGEEGEDEDDKKKKKKDRKKKEEKEPKKKSNKLAKFILEQQQRQKEEEERLKRLEEEEERRAEEARKAKEEKERLEKERKEREKQKKAARIAKQKAKGTYMTPKQKEEHRLALAKLQAMGVELPDPTQKKKRPFYDSRKKKPVHKQESVEAKVEEKEDRAVQEADTSEAAVAAEKSGEAEVDGGEEATKEEWDAESEDDTKGAWDAESSMEEEEEKPQEVAKAQAKAQPAKKVKEKDDEEEDDSEESEEESEEEEESSSEDENEGLTTAQKARVRAERRIARRKEDAAKAVTVDNLRAVVVCVLGHVDTGKTKILDKLRRTNVQDNEAGGITQQIGATNVPQSAIKDQTKMCKEFAKKELKLPGLLIIDTPGHESFSNLRTRGSSLCDIAILVVDIMHGMEPQTIESINLLRARKCPFVVALNKIDRLYQWMSNPHTDVVNQVKKQKGNTKIEFDERVQQVKLQFAEQGLNVALFYENPNPKEYISLVPTSAHTGDGMGNLIALICELTQEHLAKRVAYSPLLQATVMEVKAIPGLGTTIDVIVVNGTLKEGQTIIVPGSEGPIVTQIRGLLLPQPMKELRVKGTYDHVKELVAAQGVKVIGKDLEKALAGLPLYVAEQPDEVDIYKEELEQALAEILQSYKIKEKGVFVQASTLGSLEALLQFLKDSKIPYAGINIGPIHRRDVMKASVMLERDVQYAVILAFDVKVERDAQELADSLNIRIFTAEIIYHLFDAFTKYREEYKNKKQVEYKNVAVFPCKLRVLPQLIFNSRDPIVMGVMVDAGFVKVGTPICVPSKAFCYLGVVTSLELNHKPVDKAVKGQEVCVKIENVPGETPKLYGRHFDENDALVSRISRASIDVVKDYFRDEMSKSDWQLIIELKKLFDIF